MRDLDLIQGENIKRVGIGRDFGDNKRGAFEIKIKGETYFVIATKDFEGWDHISVTHRNGHKMPSWNLMCTLKDLFFYEDEVVMQLHPAKKDYINRHKACLHLWRPTKEGVTIPTPPKILV